MLPLDCGVVLLHLLLHRGHVCIELRRVWHLLDHLLYALEPAFGARQPFARCHGVPDFSYLTEKVVVQGHPGSCLTGQDSRELLAQPPQILAQCFDFLQNRHNLG